MRTAFRPPQAIEFDTSITHAYACLNVSRLCTSRAFTLQPAVLAGTLSFVMPAQMSAMYALYSHVPSAHPTAQDTTGSRFALDHVNQFRWTRMPSRPGPRPPGSCCQHNVRRLATPLSQGDARPNSACYRAVPVLLLASFTQCDVSQLWSVAAWNFAACLVSLAPDCQLAPRQCDYGRH